MLKKIFPIALAGALLFTTAGAAPGAEQSDTVKELNKKADEVAAGVRQAGKQARDGINRAWDGFKKKQGNSGRKSRDDSQGNDRGRGQNDGEARGR